jgi:hypothetical protein
MAKNATKQLWFNSKKHTKMTQQTPLTFKYSTSGNKISVISYEKKVDFFYFYLLEKSEFFVPSLFDRHDMITLLQSAGIQRDTWENSFMGKVNNLLLSFCRSMIRYPQALIRSQRLDSESVVKGYLDRSSTDLNKNIFRRVGKNFETRCTTWCVAQGLPRLSIDLFKTTIRDARYDGNMRKHSLSKFDLLNILPLNQSQRKKLSSSYSALINREEKIRDYVNNLPQQFHPDNSQSLETRIKTLNSIISFGNPIKVLIYSPAFAPHGTEVRENEDGEREVEFNESFSQVLHDQLKYLQAIGPENALVKQTEDMWRSLLVRSDYNYYKVAPGSSEDPDTILVNFFSQINQPKPQNVKTLVPLASGNYVDCDTPTHKKVSSFFSEGYQGLFKDFNWKNVLVAGGFVLQSLAKSETRDLLYYGTDIDLFIYGIPDESVANVKIGEILQFFKRRKEEITGKKDNSVVLISDHSVTLLGVPPFPHIQIILRLYRFNLLIYLF